MIRKYTPGQPKPCSKCGEVYPWDDYYCHPVTKKVHSHCKKCKSKARRCHEKENPGMYKASKQREKLLARYGLTVTDYESMLARQNGLCRICRRLKRRLCVDHCHKTGKVRGLLCNSCNVAIALLQEDRRLFEAAIRYLEYGNS